MRGRFRGYAVADMWASQKRDEAFSYSGTIWFSGEIIYSYGTHHPIARLVNDVDGNRVALFHAHSGCSCTTSKHTTLAHHACTCNQIPKFTVPFTNPESATTHMDNVDHFQKRLWECVSEFRSARTAKSKEFRYHSTLDRLHRANHYCELFGLLVRLQLPADVQQVQQEVKQVIQKVKQVEHVEIDRTLRKRRTIRILG